MQDYIKVRGAKEHNLKDIDIDIPKNQLVVITGLSGSGKSSLAFDTIYAESRRRYMAGWSVYAKQFLPLQNKPDVESISGLSPSIAIDQKTTCRNHRSTVGTITEIYDYLRLLFARVGTLYSPKTGLPIRRQSVSEMVDLVHDLPDGTKIYILSPIARSAKGEFKKELMTLAKQGFERIIIDGQEHEFPDLPSLDKNKKHNIEVIVDRLIIDSEIRSRTVDSLETALSISNGVVLIKIQEISADHQDYKADDTIVLSQHYSCPESGFQLPEIEPRIFSFNSPFGACKHCEGLGKEMLFSPDLIVPDSSLSITEGAIAPWAKTKSIFVRQTLESLAAHYEFSLDKSFSSLNDKIRNVLFYGSGEELIDFTYCIDNNVQKVKQPFGGILLSLTEKYRNSKAPAFKDELSNYMKHYPCTVCSGYRLQPESLCIKINKLHIGEVASMTINQAMSWFSELETHLTEKQKTISKLVIKEIKDRLSFLLNVGLDYMSIDRPSSQLSGGESQRIRLASQISSGLSGVLYVLDEPSIGLHQRDNIRLINTLVNLKELGNSVLVVEHDEEIMYRADHIVDMGPGAGNEGGKVLVQGTIEDIKNCPNSLTGDYLSGKKSIYVPNRDITESKGRYIEMLGARSNNLRNVNLKIPLGNFISITGVSGSGKSTLVIHTFYKAILKKLEPSFRKSPGEYNSLNGVEYIDKVIDINQLPIGRTPRSNPATYTGVFNHIRDWFSLLPESKARGYKVGRFSFNVKGGRCEACEGDGLVRIEMHFLPDVFVNCDVCNGKRYNRETLEVLYRGKSIADVLDMSVTEAVDFFSNVPLIFEKLKTLQEVGLGYIKIGQSASTLSGGEAQRIKLAKELSKRSTGKTLYILDEPTTGLHFADISKLLDMLHKLVALGNTVIVIEHNLSVIKTSDYIIDIGPEGGSKGGRIVAEGTPEDIMNNSESITGEFLKKQLV